MAHPSTKSEQISVAVLRMVRRTIPIPAAFSTASPTLIVSMARGPEGVSIIVPAAKQRVNSSKTAAWTSSP
jgi:hypothetical protein